MHANTINIKTVNKQNLETAENKHLVNKLDNQKKKNLKNRTVISIFVFLYYLVILVFTFLSNKYSIQAFDWISISNELAGAFAILLFIMVFIPFILSVLEAIKLVFNKSEKIPIIIISLLCSIVYIFPLLTYLIIKYFTSFLTDSSLQFNSRTLMERTYYLIILSSIFSLFLLIIVLNIIIKVYKKDSFKNVVTLNVLLLVIIFGFIGFQYTAMSKGWLTLLFLMISVILTDVMCYLWGMFFGKHKMAKVISPNKTWEGAILGTITTVLVLLIYCGFVTLDTNSTQINNNGVFETYIRSNFLLSNITSYRTNTDYATWLILFFLSVILVIFSILGDLLFSYVKRKFEIKDFSNILKSHGGILDRVDSLLMTSLVYFFYTLIATSIFIFINLVNP